MSYSGTHVYLRAGESLATVIGWLAKRLPAARVTDSGIVSLDGAEISLHLDTHPCVREEVVEMAERAPAEVRPLLLQTTQRIVIEPTSRKIDPDDIYNELLRLFEVLRDMPDAVGMDPFDGAFYLGATQFGGD
jgi:hypothetical protein